MQQGTAYKTLKELAPYLHVIEGEFASSCRQPDDHQEPPHVSFPCSPRFTASNMSKRIL